MLTDLDYSIDLLSQGFKTWYRFGGQTGIAKKSVRLDPSTWDLTHPFTFSEMHKACKKIIHDGDYARVYEDSNHVYKVVHVKDNLRNALKEAVFLHSLNHPHILQALDTQIVMKHGKITKFIHKMHKGKTLAQHCPSELSALEAVWIALAKALAYLHANNIYHGDVKPDNVLGAAGTIQLFDFSLSDKTTGPPTVTGTSIWKSPECLKDGPASTKSDVWGWAVVVLHSFMGPDYQAQFPDRQDLAILKVWDNFPVPDISPTWNALLRACLSLDPNERPTMLQILGEYTEYTPEIVPRAKLSDLVAKQILTQKASFSCKKLEYWCDVWHFFLWENALNTEHDFEAALYHIFFLSKKCSAPFF